MCPCFVFPECPLTFAAHLDGVVEMIKLLRNGGAHLDFRAKDGMTALHKAARSKNQVTLTVKDLCTCDVTLTYATLVLQHQGLVTHALNSVATEQKVKEVGAQPLRQEKT